MKITFKEESLFERFSIPTSTSKNELFKQFQTKPHLRKELPNYIQTINNEQKIFIEELFNTYIDNCKYSLQQYINEKNSNESIDIKKVFAAFVDLIRNFDSAVSEIKVSGNIFDELINLVLDKQHIENFYHENCNNALEVLEAFYDSCFLKMETEINSIVNSLNSKKVNSLNRIIGAISNVKIKERLLNCFITSLGTSFETLTIRLDDDKVLTSSISFISGLTDGIFKNKNLYPAYKYCCNKLLDGNVESDIIIKLIKRLKNDDLKPICNSYIEKSLQYILFEKIKENSFDDICDFADTAKVILDIIEENDLDIENINLLKIPVAFRDKGEEWYEQYKNNVILIVEKKSLSSAIYNICLWVYRDATLKKNKILFTNLILRTANFEIRLDSFFGYINRLEKNLDRQYGYNESLKFAAMRQAIIQKQDEMYKLIMDFYAITILSPDLVNTFDQIYQLLMENTTEALSRMKKCDNVRGASVYHKNVIEEAVSSNSYRSTYRPTSSSGCYIASCVYGSYDCPQVWILRRYRDANLGSSWFGRLFIKVYYTFSPLLVKMFGKTKWFKAIWKKYLDKKVQKLKDAGYESTPYNDKKWN